MTVTDDTASTDADTSVCHTGELPWAELAPGIEMKVLRTGVGTDRYTLMNRFAPGTVLPKHYHHGEVHAWTIEGTWGYLEYDWTASAGDYIYEPSGSVHTLAVPEDSPGPATIQFVIEKGLDFLDDDGNAFHVEDAETITQLYVDTLAAAGIERPAILP
jgi:quercetin dioxygenase-like cupin family protein